ncbi:MAG TPA: YicC/YloC family endoribonuclease [Candidatus Methylacidiphilales bacterium]|nr:YicC/YloC family endoribonuclease [Candidatus Methylacidiphilales bacterium]
MTGYGRGTAMLEGRQIAVELSSVNRKQAEIALSLPRALLELEPRVRDEINAHISRGRLTVAVGLHAKGGGKSGAMNLAAAKAYRNQLKALRKTLKLDGEITLDQVLRGPGVVDSEDTEIATETAWPALKKALKGALEQFVKMRKAEGESLAADLRKRVLAIQKSVKTIGVLAPKVMDHHRVALLDRAAKAGLEIEASDERLLKEIVFFADRSDISEELTRLRSHLDQFFGELGKDEPVGRTLDFLLQEMFRETNTIGNKANFLAISRIIVGMKTELEKLREQVQNIE